MCDCEDLEFEDFEVVLDAMPRKSAPPAAVPLKVPVVAVVAQKKRG